LLMLFVPPTIIILEASESLRSWYLANEQS
jgi:putative effector of murein hydrolase LrgA (UPF0299 family)